MRWGKDCRRIRVYKFRSMRTDLGDANGVAQTVQNDPRITRIGAIIRKTNIDELPQLLNVLKGDMSLVGPRCHAIGMLAAGIPYEDLVPNYHRSPFGQAGHDRFGTDAWFARSDRPSGRARAHRLRLILYRQLLHVCLTFALCSARFWPKLRGGKGF